MNPPPSIKPLGWPLALVCAAGAVICFTLAYTWEAGGPLMLGFFACLFPLARLRTPRRAYYFGLAVGLLIYTPHLLFFFKSFSYGAVALWYILPFWLGMFLVLGHLVLWRFGLTAWACLAPFLWTGFEFFRSELYYLRFAWLTPGLAFSGASQLHYIAWFGFYGIGFLMMAWVAAFHLKGLLRIAVLIIFLIPCTFAPALVSFPPDTTSKSFRATAIQLEFPSEPAVRSALNVALRKYPDTDLFVLSEYTFQGPVAPLITNWCREHQKYLVAGGKDEISTAQFYDTAFVIGTNGEVVFKQGKSVPVQFIADGLPATNQAIWNSPWGRIGLAICYDLSYSRVTDQLIRLGAQALVIPSMDIVDWGEAQHKLHARIAPLRAAEYGLPIFRVCSSGISQFVDKTGALVDFAPFPGDGAMFSDIVRVSDHAHLPHDRWLARFSVAVTAFLGIWFIAEHLFHRRQKL